MGWNSVEVMAEERTRSLNAEAELRHMLNAAAREKHDRVRTARGWGVRDRVLNAPKIEETSDQAR